MKNLIKNHDFIICAIYILSFMVSGKADDLWDGIGYGFDAVMAAKGF